MDEKITDKQWETWAAAALGASASNILAECNEIEEHIHLFHNGKDKVKIMDLVREIKNRAIWIREMTTRQMLDEMIF